MPLLLVLVLIPALMATPDVPVTAEDSLQRYEYRQTQMGMMVRILQYAPDEETSRRAARAGFDRIDELEDALSTFRLRSEVSRLNREAGGQAITVSDHLFRVLEFAREVASASDGAFDVTAAPLIDLWRTARQTGALPEERQLEDARERVSWQHLELDVARRTARLALPGMSVDLGAVAKGYILDRVIETLEEHGVDRALVEAGGDVRVSGPPPGEEGWRLQLPDYDGEEAVVRLSHAAISTSGDTEQYVEIDGRRYSHVVDPRTGLGLTSRIMVTVIAPEAMTSDALSTAISVMGEEEGRNLDLGADQVRVMIKHLH